MDNPTPIILIHGLHMNTLALRPLAKFLREQGYSVHLFRYYSVKDDIKSHSKRLAKFINDLQLHQVILIGHSLGGLVIRQFANDTLANPNPIIIKKVITLGTPHLGSMTAHYAKKINPLFGKLTLGKAYDGSLSGTCPPLPNGIPLGVIAGDKSSGLGKPILTYHSKKVIKNQTDSRNDGTVYVFETYADNASDHIILPVSHSGMLFNTQVFEKIKNFLEFGRFNP